MGFRPQRHRGGHNPSALCLQLVVTGATLHQFATRSDHFGHGTLWDFEEYLRTLARHAFNANRNRPVRRWHLTLGKLQIAQPRLHAKA
jgi:hypothetical protein